MVASPAKGTMTISSLPELPDSVSPDFREITLKERYSHSADFGDTSRTIPSFCSSLSCRFTATPFCFKILKALLSCPRNKHAFRRRSVGCFSRRERRAYLNRYVRSEQRRKTANWQRPGGLR